MKDLQNKVAVVTGAGEGLGRCLALRLSESGATVALVGHTESKIVGVAEDILKRGGAAVPVVCDIRNPASVASARDSLDRQFQAIDILINNAGVWTDDELEQTRPELRRNAIETNALGTIEFTEAFLPILQRRGSAHIVNVISTGGLGHTTGSDNRRWKTYGASKWAVTGYTKSLRESLAGTGVKVSSFFPGGFESNFYENAGLTAQHNQPWMMSTEAVAHTVMFMLSLPSDVLVEELVLTKFFGASA